MFLFLLIHSCQIPQTAYIQDRNLTVREYKAMENFGYCVCGPEGTVDWDPKVDKAGLYYSYPSCNRSGWNGENYQGDKS